MSYIKQRSVFPFLGSRAFQQWQQGKGRVLDVNLLVFFMRQIPAGGSTVTSEWRWTEARGRCQSQHEEPIRNGMVWHRANQSSPCPALTRWQSEFLISTSADNVIKCGYTIFKDFFFFKRMIPVFSNLGLVFVASAWSFISIVIDRKLLVVNIHYSLKPL